MWVGGGGVGLYLLAFKYTPPVNGEANIAAIKLLINIKNRL